MTQERLDTDDFAFIGAVHTLMQSAGSAEKTDLLLAACLHALHEMDRETNSVVGRVAQTWPGVRPAADQVHAALEAGVTLGLVGRTSTLDGAEVWTLTKAGVDDLNIHGGWVREVRARAVAEVRERALDGLQVDVEEERASMWLDRLVRGLAAAIHRSQEAYLGNIESLVGSGHIAPRALTRDAIANEFAGDDPISQFIQTLALAALDQLDPFGNELVSHITTGCILHAFVAGVDRHHVLEKLGPPEGRTLVLDTPLLIELIGPRRLAEPLERTVAVAASSGWKVVALEHSIFEAQEVLHREVPRIQSEFQTAVAQGIRESWYASLQEDQLPGLCIEVIRDGTYKNVAKFLEAADDLPVRLEGLGVTVRPHGNGDDWRVAKLTEALTSELEGVKQRSPHVIQRDADSMAMVWRQRRRANGRWPGGWVVTTDRAMAPAYLAANPSDRVSLTLTPARLAALLTVTAAPGNLEQLAEAAASQFVEEAMWALPVRYPRHTALELARQLSPEHGGSQTDLRVAQLTLDGVLDSAPDTVEMSASVLSARSRRVNQMRELEAKRLNEGVKRTHEEAQQAELRASKAETDALRAAAEREQLRQHSEGLERDLEWSRTQLGRVGVSTALGLIAALLLGFAVTTLSVTALSIMGVGCALLAIACWRWCTVRESKLAWVLGASIVALLGVVADASSVWQMLNR